MSCPNESLALRGRPAILSVIGIFHQQMSFLVLGNFPDFRADGNIGLREGLDAESNAGRGFASAKGVEGCLQDRAIWSSQF